MSGAASDRPALREALDYARSGDTLIVWKLDRLAVPAYGDNINKSQGSEYPAVIIPVMTRHYPMLQRNLLYTGLTRGKRLVVLVGQKKAIAIAVRNVSARRRWSKLDEWLRVGALSRSSSSSKVDWGEIRTNFVQRREVRRRLGAKPLLLVTTCRSPWL